MRNRLLLILTFILLTMSSNSQDFCTAPASSEYKELILDTYRHVDFSQYSFCVKIYIHVIRKNDGTGGQSHSNIIEALGYLDAAFNPHNIFFNWNNSINYINNTNLYNHPGGILNITTYDHSDGVDIYLFDDETNHPVSGHGYGSTDGIGLSSKLLVTGSWGDNLEHPLVRSHILSHEMGHVLFLWHTHHGTVIEAGDPDQCAELVNGDIYNRVLCGDYISDTSAVPGMGYNVDINTCEWLGSGVDVNNDPYTPDELNRMSYTEPVCMDYFTPKQSARMKTALALLSHLKLVSYYHPLGNPCLAVDSGLIYYPNSANEILHLDLRDKPTATYNYQIYNNIGNIVLSGQSQNILKTIDISALDVGVYFLHFYENGDLIIRQIVIDR